MTQFHIYISGFWKWIPPKGRPPRADKTFQKKIRILKMDSPEGETPAGKNNFKIFIYLLKYLFIYLNTYLFI